MITTREALGGKCMQCGATNKLEIDHIDPKLKSFSISNWVKGSKNALQGELKKCQLLCKPCHTIKTITDCGKTVAKGIHGAISSYRYCHCTKCREAKYSHYALLAKK